jgi:chromosome segregation ATPase
MTTRRFVFSIGLLSLVLIVAAALSAQAPVRSLPAGTPLEDILTEIKGLRADIAQSSSITVRTQLLVARLQVQEQRINNLLKQVNDVQTELNGVRRTRLDIQLGIQAFEREQDALSQAPMSQERSRMEAGLKEQIAGRQAEMKLQRQREVEVTARANELSRQLAAEQSQWNEFNDRLDALERSLPAR